MTVIGWAWMILGGLMLGSALLSTLASLSIGMPFAWFPVLLVVQAGVGVLGAVSGRRFLRLEARARPILELLSWLVLAALLGFAVYWVAAWVGTAGGTGGFAGMGAIMGAIMGVIITLLYAAPVAVMIHYLRSDRVREALS